MSLRWLAAGATPPRWYGAMICLSRASGARWCVVHVDGMRLRHARCRNSIDDLWEARPPSRLISLLGQLWQLCKYRGGVPEPCLPLAPSPASSPARRPPCPQPPSARLPDVQLVLPARHSGLRALALVALWLLFIIAPAPKRSFEPLNIPKELVIHVIYPPAYRCPRYPVRAQRQSSLVPTWKPSAMVRLGPEASGSTAVNVNVLMESIDGGPAGVYLVVFYKCGG